MSNPNTTTAGILTLVLCVVAIVYLASMDKLGGDAKALLGLIIAGVAGNSVGNLFAADSKLARIIQVLTQSDQKTTVQVQDNTPSTVQVQVEHQEPPPHG